MIASAIRFARSSSSTAAVVLLVGFNLVPLAGVLFGGWNVWTLLVLYWVENGIVGALNVPRMLLAQGDDAATRMVDASVIGPLPVPGSGSGSKIVLVAFFLAHYGIFWFVHGVFIFGLAAFASATGSGSGPFDTFGGVSVLPGQTLPPEVIDALGLGGTVDVVRPAGPDLGAVAWGAIGLAISHVASFVVNYVGRREYLATTPTRQMFAPYGRVVILHLTILFGAFLSIALGNPIWAVVVLVLIKTAVDLAFHLREHGRSGAPAAVA